MWEGGPPEGGGGTLSPQSLDVDQVLISPQQQTKPRRLREARPPGAQPLTRLPAAALPSARLSEGVDSCPRLGRRLLGRLWVWSQSPSAGGEKDVS